MTTKNVRECASCAKRRGKECAVLVERIGEYVECWAWTDNEHWEREAEEATRRYAESRGKAG
ncbi:MAG: hypothetical protein AB1441_00890 [Bacillota bacterium]